jgi:hypothetical protein
MENPDDVKAYFSDYFGVLPQTIEDYGAFNVSLINDLPLFIDPFLLFNSSNAKYRALHDEIIKYIRFLRDKSIRGNLNDSLIRSWYTFREVKQNWLGFSLSGNNGSGLGEDFAVALYSSLHKLFSDFGDEQVTRGSHLEKLCLFKEGVGKDNISDFTTNLIKEYLVEYTQTFAQSHIHKNLRKRVGVSKVRFNYETERWESRVYELPFIEGDYVILTPKDMLTRDETWINRNDLYNDFDEIPYAIPNDQLRAQINNYFAKVLPKEPSKKERLAAIKQTIQEFPQIIDYYIKDKEDNGDLAADISSQKVQVSHQFYVEQFKHFIAQLNSATDFYALAGDSYEEALARVNFLKDVIENQDGYRYFYANGEPIRRESDLHILFRLTWYATPSDVNREVNNGRGPVDFKISRGSADSTLVEFKLASNSKLKKNLEKQVEIYKKASNTEKAIKVVVYFTELELNKVLNILDELNMKEDKNIILINARSDNKVSASNA